MFAYLLRGVHTHSLVLGVVLGFACAVCIASANYVINEWLDRDFDKFHPTKSQRAAVQKNLRGGYVVLEWAILVVAGLALAYAGGRLMLLAAVIFAPAGHRLQRPAAAHQGQALPRRHLRIDQQPGAADDRLGDARSDDPAALVGACCSTGRAARS